MKCFLAGSLLIVGIVACSATKKVSPSAIGFTTLHNYLLNPDISLPDTIHYAFITNAKEFHKMFYMTKASPGTAVVPDFTSHSAVAIILQPTGKVVSVDIQKVEIAGSELRILYAVTDTTSWKSYLHTPMILATVAKNVSVKQVSFYSNGVKEKTIATEY